MTDARAVKTDDSERLVRMVTGIVTDALRAAASQPTAPRTLAIAITQHEVVFHNRRWYSATRFRVTLQEGPRQVATWTAAGEDRRLNMLPAYIDAEEGSQAGFDRAIANLMAELSTPPP